MTRRSDFPALRESLIQARWLFFLMMSSNASDHVRKLREMDPEEWARFCHVECDWVVAQARHTRDEVWAAAPDLQQGPERSEPTRFDEVSDRPARRYRSRCMQAMPGQSSAASKSGSLRSDTVLKPTRS